MKNQLALLGTLLLLGLGCSSPQKLYEKGKYFKSYDAVLKDLQKGKKDRKALLLLNKSFAKMIDQANGDMKILKDGYKVNDLVHNFKQYAKVDSRFADGKIFLNDENEILYARFLSEKHLLVEDTYAEGSALMRDFETNNNKMVARDAYTHFELVQEYSNLFVDIANRLQEALEAATIIYAIDSDLDSDFSYQWEVDRRFDDLEGEKQFYQIVYDDRSVQEDCRIELDFARLDVEEHSKERNSTFTKNVLDGYETKTDTSGKKVEIPIYKDVSAQVVITTFTKNVSWRVDLEIVKSTQNCDLREDRFKASAEDQIEVIEVYGDERAVPDEYQNVSNEQLKDTDDMVEEILDALFRDIRNYIY